METTNQPTIHIFHPNIIKVYLNSQVQSQLTLVHQALCTGLHLVPLVGGCGVGCSGWVAEWPHVVTGHWSLACPPFVFNVFLISPFSKHLFQRSPETPSLRRSADEPHSSGQFTLQQIKNITTAHNKPYGEDTQQQKLKPWRVYMAFSVMCRIWKTLLATNTPTTSNLITSSPDKQNLLTISR